MPYLSEVFSYISHFRRRGHQIGRKVGDMLELLTLSGLATDPEIESRLIIEPKIRGNSEARHKVEFAIRATPQFDETGLPQVTYAGDITHLDNLIAFIECKKVGVEQTINTSFKNRFRTTNNLVEWNQYAYVNFQSIGVQYRVSFHQQNNQTFIQIHDLTTGTNEPTLVEPISDGHRIIFCHTDEDGSQILGNNESLRDLNNIVRGARILEIHAIEPNGVKCILNDCLPGPQTPEKAKQASFVALDIRKLKHGTFDKQENETDLLSVLVLTEFSHWEAKSKNMVRSALDLNLVVDDARIVDAFRRFEAEFGADFYDQITKDKYRHDPDVRRIIDTLVEEHDRRIFCDIDDAGNYKAFAYRNGRICTLQ